MKKYRILGGPRESTYLLYGIRVSSDVEMVDQVQVQVQGPNSDLRFNLVTGVPPRFEEGLVPVWRSSIVDPDGESGIVLSKGSGFRLLRITHQADFFITSTAVQCRLGPDEPFYTSGRDLRSRGLDARIDPPAARTTSMNGRLLPKLSLICTGRVDYADWNYRPVLGRIQRQRYRLCLSPMEKRRIGKLLVVGYGSGVFMQELIHAGACPAM